MTNSNKVNHSTYEKGLWIKYDGSAFNDFYDVKTEDAIFFHCQHKEGCFYREDISIHKEHVSEVRLCSDSEISEAVKECAHFYDVPFSGKERNERNLKEFPNQVPFFTLDDYLLTIDNSDYLGSSKLIVTQYIGSSYNTVNADGYSLKEGYLVKESDDTAPTYLANQVKLYRDSLKNLIDNGNNKNMSLSFKEKEVSHEKA